MSTNSEPKLSEGGAASLPRAKGRFVSHVFTLITGNGTAQAINVAGTLCLARLFAPDAFGLFALFVAVVSLVSVLGGGRYELGIMLPDDDEEAANILILSTLVLLGIAGACVVAVAVFHERLGDFLGNARLSQWLWGMPLALFVTGFHQALGYWSGRMKQFRRVAISRVCQALATVTIQVILFVLHTGDGLALIGGWILGQCIGTLLLLIQVLRDNGRFLMQVYNWLSVRDALNKYKDFPIYKAPYSFVSNASSQLVFVILRMFSDLSSVGLFSLASRAVYLPVRLVSSSMNPVFYERAATELKYGRLEPFVTRALRIQVVLATPVLILVAFNADLLFGFFLGAQWAAAGVYATMLVFPGYLHFLTAWLDRLFDVQGRQRLSLILAAAGNILTLGGLSLALWSSRDTVLAVGVYSGVEVVWMIVWLCFAYHVAHFGVRHLALLAKDAIISALPALIVIGAIHIVFSSWMAFFLSAFAVFLVEVVYFVRYVPGGHAFSSAAERFRHFWDGKLRRNNNSDDYSSHANELRSLFPAHAGGRMLEIGCGEGRLFSHLQVPVAMYKGIDFCQRLIDAFRVHHPDARLECAEGASYRDPETLYDLILLNGVVQHFDRAMLEMHLKNARAMMHRESLLIWTSVPDREYRTPYDLGMWSGMDSPSAVRWLKSWLRRILGLDLMGYWYEPQEITALAAEQGFDCDFIRSKTSPYRVHVVMRTKYLESGSGTAAVSDRKTHISPQIQGVTSQKPPYVLSLR